MIKPSLNAGSACLMNKRTLSCRSLNACGFTDKVNIICLISLPFAVPRLGNWDRHNSRMMCLIEFFLRC